MNRGSELLKSKLRASTIHLLISLAIVGSFLAFAFSYWYPGALSEVSGLIKVALIMLAIDLVLGPLLTLILYNTKKSRRALVTDFTFIVAIQLTALVYGAHTIYEGHPLYITYATDRFTLVTANEVDPQQAIHDPFRKSKLAGPDLVFAKQPDDPKEVEKIMFEVLEGAPDIDKRPQLYVPIDSHMDSVFSKSLDIAKFFDREETKKEFLKFVDEHGDHENFAFLPLSGQGKDVIWALDRKSGKPVDIININPWALVVNQP